MQQWLVGWVGEDAARVLTVALAILFVLILVLVLVALARRTLGGGLGIRRGGQAPRLAVVDIAGIDQRRKLVLVRRDGVEHLILIGGPNDLVVEPSIQRTGGGGPRAAARSEPALRAEPGTVLPAGREPASDPFMAAGPASGQLPPSRTAPGRLPQAPAEAAPPPPPLQRDAPVVRPRTETPTPEPREPANARFEPSLISDIRPGTERGTPRAGDVRAPRIEPEVGPPNQTAPVVSAVEARRTPPLEREPETRLRAPLRPAAASPERPVRPPAPAGPPPAPRSMVTPTLGASREPSEPARPSPGDVELRQPSATGSGGTPSRQPLSVRSFATAIQNRGAGEVPQKAAPAPEAVQRPVQAAEPRPVPATTPAFAQAPSPRPDERDDDVLADLLEAEFANDVGAPLDRDSDTATAPSLDSRLQADPGSAETPAGRRPSLEEEMERLLHDFSLETSNRR